METKFKCCGKVANFCCVVCFSTFHPSCLGRRSDDIIHLGGIKIYCTKQCQEQADLEENKVVSLQKEIEQLNLTVIEKQTFIKRLKRRTKDFEDLVFDSEQKFEEKVKEQDEIIKTLNRELLDLKIKNSNLQEEIEIHREKYTKFEKEVKETNMFLRNMTSTIHSLEKDNEAYEAETKKLRLKIDELLHKQDFMKNVSCQTEQRQLISNNDNAQGNFMEPFLCAGEQGSSSSSLLSCGRVLLLSDQFGYGLGGYLKKLVSSVRVQAVIKPYATLAGVLEDVGNMTRDFTFNDHIVILCGFNDLRNYKIPSFKNIADKLASVSKTNVVFISVPYSIKNYSKVNNTIYKFNNKLMKFLDRINQFTEGRIAFVDSNDVNGVPLQKSKLAGIIAGHLLEKPRQKNLIFIHTSSIQEAQLHVVSNVSNYVSNNFNLDSSNAEYPVVASVLNVVHENVDNINFLPVVADAAKSP